MERGVRDSLPRVRRLAFPGPHLDPPSAHICPAALYGWAEALAALLDDSVMVPTLEGGRQPLREAVVVDSQGHHRWGGGGGVGDV